MVNIFGGHSIIIMRKELIWTCVQFWMGTERERELFESTKRKALWMVIEKDKLLGGNCILILIYCLNKKFVTQKWQGFFNKTDSCVWWRYLLINPRKEYLVCVIESRSMFWQNVKIKILLKKETARYSDTLVPIYQTTRLHALEDNHSCQLCGILNPSK